MQQLQRTQLQPPRLNPVRDNGFEGCEEGAEEGKDEAQRCKVVVPGGGETDAGDDGEERDVGHCGVGFVEEDDVDDYGEEGGHGADDLVEGDCDEVAGGVSMFIWERGGTYRETLLMAMLMV